MPKYKYVGSDHTGKKVTGIANSVSTSQLYKDLKQEFIYVHYATVVEDKETVSYKLKSGELADFCRQIGTMQRTGIPLIKSIQMMQDQKLPPKLEKIFQRLFEIISQGNDLSYALEQCNGSFPNLMINMLRSGESSGNLDATCIKMADYYAGENKLNAKIKGAMAYPSILGVMTVGITLGMFTLILPNFFDIFENSGTELPAITLFVVAISAFIMEQWAILIFGTIALVLLVKYLLTIEKVLYKLDEIKTTLPTIGELLSIIYTARFARTLSSLYSSGVSMLEAVEVSVTTIGNRFVEDQFAAIVEKIKGGETLSVAMQGVEGLHEKLVSTIYIGEETGRLDDMLISISEEYEYESEMAIDRMLTFVEPVMIVVMAVIVGGVMMAVMVPVINMSQTVS
ncbi:MAG: type II secretion system F family protein [Clostridia bacterium]